MEKGLSDLTEQLFQEQSLEQDHKDPPNSSQSSKESYWRYKIEEDPIWTNQVIKNLRTVVDDCNQTPQMQGQSNTERNAISSQSLKPQIPETGGPRSPDTESFNWGWFERIEDSDAQMPIMLDTQLSDELINFYLCGVDYYQGCESTSSLPTHLAPGEEEPKIAESQLFSGHLEVDDLLAIDYEGRSNQKLEENINTCEFFLVHSLFNYGHGEQSDTFSRFSEKLHNQLRNEISKRDKQIIQKQVFGFLGSIQNFEDDGNDRKQVFIFLSRFEYQEQNLEVTCTQSYFKLKHQNLNKGGHYLESNRSMSSKPLFLENLRPQVFKFAQKKQTYDHRIGSLRWVAYIFEQSQCEQLTDVSEATVLTNFGSSLSWSEQDAGMTVAFDTEISKGTGKEHKTSCDGQRTALCRQWPDFQTFLTREVEFRIATRAFLQDQLKARHNLNRKATVRLIFDSQETKGHETLQLETVFLIEEDALLKAALNSLAFLGKFYSDHPQTKLGVEFLEKFVNRNDTSSKQKPMLSFSLLVLFKYHYCGQSTVQKVSSEVPHYFDRLCRRPCVDDAILCSTEEMKQSQQSFLSEFQCSSIKSTFEILYRELSKKKENKSQELSEKEARLYDVVEWTLTEPTISLQVLKTQLNLLQSIEKQDDQCLSKNLQPQHSALPDLEQEEICHLPQQNNDADLQSSGFDSNLIELPSERSPSDGSDDDDEEEYIYL